MPMFPSRFMPCPDCGASLDLTDHDEHTCARERWLDYQMFHLKDVVARFESDLRRYLSSPQGRFEVWYARRQR